MEGRPVSEVFLLSERQMERIEPFFPLAHGVPRVDDRRVLSGIVYVIRNGLQWKDAPKAYGPHKTLYNRFIRWSRLGVFDRIFVALTGITTRKCILRTLGVNTCRTGHIEVHATSRDAGTRSGRNAPASGCSSTFQR
jgi:transposase